ncbi:MAG: hypothetical protein AB1483_09670 [Candidatus Zixiibacteriota bacterium]
MKKFIGIMLLVVFVMSFVAGAMVSPTQAKGSDDCREICHRALLFMCCGPNTTLGPGCIQIGRCE